IVVSPEPACGVILDTFNAVNQAEDSHKPKRRRERRMGRFKSPGSMQLFLSVHDTVYNHF
ncbi:MAG: hypothetical protein KUG58_01130, partial [Marinosulfonomonas sp.]|nr:hypothetical protein [Marinosulfonomonas sp.]